MNKKLESGKTRLVKGSLLYLWEEIKTMNRRKFQALFRIMSGYVRMRIQKSQKITHRRNLDLSLDEN